jgi:putative peptidoglycan lipid II flippase
MVKKLFGFLGREIKGLHEAAYVLALFAFLSQILGLIRDRLFANYFGAGELLDIYYAAFRIPDFIFTIIIALVSSSVLVPFLVKLYESDPEKQKQFNDSIFTGLLLLAGVVSIGVFIFIKPLLTVIFPGMMAGAHAQTLLVVTSIMLLQPILLAVSGFFASYLQVFQKFFMYAISPLFYNLGIIIGIVWLYPTMGLAGLAWGVVLGSVLHMLSQAIPVRARGVRPTLTLRPKWGIIWEVIQLSLPRTIAVTGSQIASLVLVSLAGIMTAGSISIFTLALNLQSVPMAIIGMSYSMAAFPTLTRLFAQGDTEEFLAHIVRAARHIIFWSVPVTVLFIVLRAQIVRTILGSGAFGWSETRLVAASLALFALSVVAQSLIMLFVRGYYSTGETKKPLWYAITSVVITIASALGLYYLFYASPVFVTILEDVLRVSGEVGTAVLVLPLAFSIGQIAYACMLWFSFDRQYKCFSDTLWKTIFHTTTASVIMGAVAYGMLQVFDDMFDLNTLTGIFSQGALAGVVGIVAGCVTLVLLKNEEIMTVGKTLHTKFWKRAHLVAIEEDL